MTDTTPVQGLQRLVREIASKLETAEQAAYALGQEASSVRPTISQAKNALTEIGFRETLERL